MRRVDLGAPQVDGLDMRTCGATRQSNYPVNTIRCNSVPELFIHTYRRYIV